MGDASIRADQGRNDFGVDGTGAKVGILSDSFANQLGGALELRQMRNKLADVAEQRRVRQQELLERGIDHRNRAHYGTYPGALIYSDRMSFLYTEEGLNILRPIMLGGATGMFAGCASPPPSWNRKSPAC